MVRAGQADGHSRRDSKDPKAAKGTNKVVVRDPNAPPLWARFYNIETNAPVFADRDGIPKATLAEIGDERRNGYAWYGNWPQKLLERNTQMEKGVNGEVILR